MSRSLSELLEEHGVPTLASINEAFAKPYNLRLIHKPEIIAIPRTVEEVQAAVKCAQLTSTKVAARSGGHSYASFGLGGKDGSLVIDMSMHFNGVSVDVKTGIARVGGGERLGNLALDLWEYERAYPHGTCPGVGLAGHSLFGGFGPSSRNWGLAHDQIISLSVVLADGSYVTASKDENPDLYWAFRGAGPSFGIVTEFTLQTFAAPKHNIMYEYIYHSDDPEVSTQAFLAVQEFGQNGPPKELSLSYELKSSSDLGKGTESRLKGVYYGTKNEFISVIAPLVAELNTIFSGPSKEPTVKDESWIRSVEILADADDNPLRIKPGTYKHWDRFFAKSIVQSAADPLTKENILPLFKYLLDKGEKIRPGVHWFVIINLYGGGNSAVTAPPEPTSPDSTSSYGHRDSLFVFQLYASSGDREQHTPSLIPFLDGMSDAVVNGQKGKFGGYPGYIDPTLTPTEAHELYYGDAYPRLHELKKKYDPHMLFWNPLVIGES